MSMENGGAQVASREEEELMDDPEQYEFALGMMEAMESGGGDQEATGETSNISNEAAEEELEFARGMMEAMEENAAEEEEQQEITPLARLSENILKACSSVSTAVREYYGMSQDDQLKVWDDLTGSEGIVEKAQDDDTAVLEAALKQLPLEFQRMPASHPHEALDQALQQDSGYVHALLVPFLRAERLDVFAAAVRMCRYFEDKLDLFGPEALTRDIAFKDLNEDDMAAFQSGYIQILQDRDFGQRPVIFYYKAVSSECYKHRENILRAYFFMMDRLSKQEEIQKLGVCNLVYNVGGFPRQGMDYEKSRRFSCLLRAMPIRFNSLYVCLDDKPWITVVETFAVMIGRFMRVRLRMMKGTHEEVVSKLQAVGVPAHALPVNAQSELLVEDHLEWIQRQRREEEEQKSKQSNAASDQVAENFFGAEQFQAQKAIRLEQGQKKARANLNDD